MNRLATNHYFPQADPVVGRGVVRDDRQILQRLLAIHARIDVVLAGHGVGRKREAVMVSDNLSRLPARRGGKIETRLRVHLPRPAIRAIHMNKHFVIFRRCLTCEPVEADVQPLTRRNIAGGKRIAHEVDLVVECGGNGLRRNGRSYRQTVPTEYTHERQQGRC